MLIVDLIGLVVVCGAWWWWFVVCFLVVFVGVLVVSGFCGGW